MAEFKEGDEEYKRSYGNCDNASIPGTCNPRVIEIYDWEQVEEYKRIQHPLTDEKVQEAKKICLECSYFKKK